MIISLLLTSICRPYISAINAFIEVYKSLINQTSHMFTQLIIMHKLPKHKLYILILILYVWLLCANCINKSFSSVLLKTFFTLKFVPIVETLDDVITNDKLLIGTQIEVLQEISDVLEEYRQPFSALIKRHHLYETKLN